jgi:Ran-binding protein 3
MERTSAADTLGSNGHMEGSGEDDQEEKQVSFGEKLRADKDESDDGKSDDEQGKIALTEQESEYSFYSISDVMPISSCVLICSVAATGEEEEETLHQARGKLFALSPENQWKERGTGTLKLNVQKADHSHPRLCE